MDIVQELRNSVGVGTKDITTMHGSIYAENAGALVLAEKNL